MVLLVLLGVLLALDYGDLVALRLLVVYLFVSLLLVCLLVEFGVGLVGLLLVPCYLVGRYCTGGLWVTYRLRLINSVGFVICVVFMCLLDLLVLVGLTWHFGFVVVAGCWFIVCVACFC